MKVGDIPDWCPVDELFSTPEGQPRTRNLKLTGGIMSANADVR